MKKMYNTSLLVTIALISFVLFFLLFRGYVDVHQLKKSFGIKDEEYFFQPFEVTTNIDITSKETKFIKVQIIVSTLDKDIYENMDKYTYPIRDILITYINGQKKDKLINPSNREHAKTEIANLIEQKLKIDVEGVYFVDFIAQ